jgi:ribosome-associated protein
MMNEEYDYEYEYDENGEIVYYAVRPNKTQIKKDLAVLFALSEEMSELSAAQLKLLELPEKIHKAVEEVAGMPHKGARKRLLKFITGQLHKINVEPVLEKLARMKTQSAHAVREHHIAERWRDKLIAGGHDALTELLDEQPQADRQQLRQLLRNAQKEAQANKPPKSSRLLYRYLKDLFKVEGEDEFDQEIEEGR